ncbi:MAG TPA: hypothetical protein VFC44_06975 [Candidatus Saccharimonadales bacterium]|nr:hypothetical protein [Candidatus Saccharimonadales bacterium]
MKELARLKNGYCLSTQYVNGQTPLLWRCQNGHEWLAVPESIKNAGTWCASCASGVSERICRAVLEKMFRCTFYKKKPKWLQTARNTLMELDGYSEEFNIAFEYHGIQHFLRNIRFHSETATLERRLADDRRKVALCRQHGIILLQIPYTVPHIEFENYIRKLLRPHNKNPHVNEVLTRITDDRIDLSTLNAYSPASLLEMQQLANKRGGQCLSKIYVNNRTKLRWRCKFGHFWEASPVAVRRGRWCHKCGGFLPHTLADMRLLAHKRGGECLATKYAGRKTKISWRCAKGHIWQTTPGGVIAGAWCPYCANRPPITIEDVQALAKTRRGECLSTRYVNSQTKLRFRCVEGHEWETIWNRLQQGMWCPACGRRKACNKRRSPPHDPNAQHTAR